MPSQKKKLNKSIEKVEDFLYKYNQEQVNDLALRKTKDDELFFIDKGPSAQKVKQNILAHEKLWRELNYPSEAKEDITRKKKTDNEKRVDRMVRNIQKEIEKKKKAVKVDYSCAWTKTMSDKQPKEKQLFDIWDSKLPPRKLERRFPQIEQWNQLAVQDTMPSHPSLKFKPSSLPAVPIVPPGFSYRPDAKEYADTVKDIFKKAKRRANKLKKILKQAPPTKTENDSQPEMIIEIAPEKDEPRQFKKSKKVDSEEPEKAKKPDKAKKTSSKKKTVKERKKERRQHLERVRQAELGRRKHTLKQLNRIDQIGSVVQKKTEFLRIRRKIRKANNPQALLQTKTLRFKKRFIEPIVFPIAPSKLPKRLVGLQPNANLFVDRILHLRRRNMIDNFRYQRYKKSPYKGYYKEHEVPEGMELVQVR